MKAVIQRVSYASVAIAGEIISEIGSGLLILIGVIQGDVEKDVDYMVNSLKSAIYELKHSSN